MTIQLSLVAAVQLHSAATLMLICASPPLAANAWLAGDKFTEQATPPITITLIEYGGALNMKFAPALLIIVVAMSGKPGPTPKCAASSCGLPYECTIAADGGANPARLIEASSALVRLLLINNSASAPSVRLTE